jgi:hypothetical protein
MSKENTFSFPKCSLSPVYDQRLHSQEKRQYKISSVFTFPRQVFFCLGKDNNYKFNCAWYDSANKREMSFPEVTEKKSFLRTVSGNLSTIEESIQGSKKYTNKK